MEPPEAPAGHVYPTGMKLGLLMTSLYIAMFLVALVGWYGAAYMLTNCALLLVFGKIYIFLNVKTVFLTTVVLFEVASAVCGAAPNSVAFIIGRAIAGLGAAGVQEEILVLIVYAAPLAKQPQYQGFFGAVYGISSIVGPLIGGAFTSNVSWRWCFYINLPFGGVVLLFVFFLLRVPEGVSFRDSPAVWKHKLAQLNLEGVVILLSGVVCLCLALQWGGFTYSWSDGRIIALLTVVIVLLIAFISIQILRPKTATVPPHIFIQRSILARFWVSCTVGVHMTLFVYYLPIWFQTVKGDSAVESGIHLLPMVIAMVVSSILSGIGTVRVGYYTPILIAGTCLVSVGSGLLTMLQVDSTTGQWIGYKIVYGFGLGCCFQAPKMAAQTVLPRREVAIGASLMLFEQTLFGAIFVSVGQNVVDQRLALLLARIAGVGLTPGEIESAGLTGLLDRTPSEDHPAVLEAYNSSLRLCFLAALAFACLSVIGSAGMEWRNKQVREEVKEAGRTRSL
ncbi:hypothetical protein ASPZODRAFT_148720 [Penicilliopsis zonata CBS 506.65]|uniref:Major facilitator superfamily (MFS) profile domain-containing protein n=1 Tax=Penicilliopsis zonata CBS 506.65 TaxID=1073090 RepID=A0A1L9SW61_9EURO|nr:hypothetical protein ASPZODRAFT_148720 [Penicilliopsis zonata CBS 506.65]OJJ51442.1 hypothetical protein ASPZODRAFT_148720 [Penicilliopsis zonata CBS 506.65]